MTPALAPAGAIVTVRVIDDRVPRLAAYWPRGATLDLHEARAVEHALTAAAWRASRGRAWEVRAVHGSDRFGTYAGAEVVLDHVSYQTTAEACGVLAGVAEGMG